MKYIKINQSKLKKEEITKEVVRIKVLIINHNKEILLGYSHHCYQFIGGHLEPGESLIECLKREVLEETGITLEHISIEPFLLKEEYYKDYPERYENYNSKIYYFAIETDLKPNLSQTKYTREELEGNFQYQYIKLDEFEHIIIENYKKWKEAEVIGKEMLVAFRELKKLKFN